MLQDPRKEVSALSMPTTRWYCSYPASSRLPNPMLSVRLPGSTTLLFACCCLQWASRRYYCREEKGNALRGVGGVQC